MYKKLVIAFEGIEGSGKSHHINKVANYLKKKKISFLLLREPGGNPNSEKIRKLILDKKSKFNKKTDLLLYLSSRSENIDTLKKRLNQRGEDTEKIINQRMESSIKDLSYSKFADYCVVNDNFDLALYHLQSIILGNKSNSRFLSDWIKSLMIVN